jgi:hypothetical protein
MKDKILVLDGGMVRSGSTWLFNVLRILFLKKTNKLWSGVLKNWNGELESDVTLIKIHAFQRNEKLIKKSDFVFYSFRDLRDVVASIKRKNGKDCDIEYVDNLVKEFEKWKKVSDYSMKYENMIKDNCVEIKKYLIF